MRWTRWTGNRRCIRAYVGQSRALHYWPWAMVVAGAIPLVLGNAFALLLFFVPAVACGLLLPWRFAVFPSGIALWFVFGKRRFVSKAAVRIRAGLGDAVVLPRGADSFGYPLTDGFLRHNSARLRVVLVEEGYDVSF